MSNNIIHSILTKSYNCAMKISKIYFYKTSESIIMCKSPSKDQNIRFQLFNIDIKGTNLGIKRTTFIGFGSCIKLSK